MQIQNQKHRKTELGEIPEEWSIKQLSEIGEITGGGTPDTLKKEYWENGDIPWAVPTDLTGLKTNYIEKTERYITKKGLENSSAKLLPKGSVIITSRATVGTCAINSVPIATNQGFQSLICNTENNNNFFLYNIQFNRNKLLQKSHGTTFLEISKSNIKNLKILVPPLKEQQKIASILSNVDNLIQKTDQVIEQTQRLKKGLMQRLLTKGIGHTKFKKESLGQNLLNYEIPADWKIMKVEDIASVHGRIGWKGLKREEYVEKGPLMLSVWSLIDEHPYGVNYNVGVNRLSLFRYDESPEIKLQKGDILLAKDGDIGRLGYVKDLPEPTTVNSHVVVIRTRNNKVNSEFLYWYMRSDPFQKYCKAFTSGTTVPLLSQFNIKRASIPIPNLNEQNVISSILYSFSKNISNTKTYKQELEILKKGLMQQLLTGKIRVKV